MGRLEPRRRALADGRPRVRAGRRSSCRGRCSRPVIAGGGPLTRCAPNCPDERAPARLGARASSRWPARPRRTPRSPSPSRRSSSTSCACGRLAPAAAGADGRRRDLAAVPARLLRLQLQRVDPPRRPGHARRAGLGRRGHARAAAARLPDRAAAGGAVRGAGAAQPARAARGAADAGAVARRRSPTALDDDALQLGYYDPVAARFRESDGDGARAARARRAGARGCRSTATASRWRRW